MQDERYVVVPNAAYIINKSWLPLKGRMIKEQGRKELLFIGKSCTRCNQLLFLSPSVFKGEEGYDQISGCLSDGECAIFYPQSEGD